MSVRCYIEPSGWFTRLTPPDIVETVSSGVSEDITRYSARKSESSFELKSMTNLGKEITEAAFEEVKAKALANFNLANAQEELQAEQESHKPWSDKKKMLYLARYWKTKFENSARNFSAPGEEVLARHNIKLAETTLKMAAIVTAYCNTTGIQILTCDDCHEPYFGNSKSKYCSTKCRMAAHRKSKKAND